MYIDDYLDHIHEDSHQKEVVESFNDKLDLQELIKSVHEDFLKERNKSKIQKIGSFIFLKYLV